jgi:hypothetical protein
VVAVELAENNMEKTTLANLRGKLAAGDTIYIRADIKS